MRFPRNTRIFRGQLDVAPFAGVLLLLVVFLLLNSSLVFVPGVPIQLPQTARLPGLDGPTVVVAVDASGQFYFDNQIIDESNLAEALRRAVTELRQTSRPSQESGAGQDNKPESMTLVVKADAQVEYKVLTRLWLLARDAGITNLLQATYGQLAPTTLPAKP